MKKLLLTAFTFLLSTTAALASDVVETVTPSSSNMPNIDSYTGTFKMAGQNGKNYTVNGFSNHNNDTNWSANPMRCGRKNNASTPSIVTDFMISASVDKVDLAIWRRYAQGTGTNPYKINSIKVYVSSASDFSNPDSYTADISSLSTAANGIGTVTINITDPKPSQYYRITLDLSSGSNNGWLAVNTINFYGQLSEDAVAAPTISSDDNNMVTITSSDADASIYYTINGDEPTTSSTPYSAPFAITEDTTVKAIAVKGGKSSAVNTYNAIFIPTYANFTELAAGEFNKVSKVKNLKVVYQSGQSLYMYDEDNNGMLYYGSYETFEPGTTFTSVTGKYVNHNNNTPEVTNATFVGKATGTPVVPEDFALEDFGNGERYKYVKISGVDISNIDGKRFNLSDNTKKDFAGYNQFNIDLKALTGCEVIGIVEVYGGTTTQIYPIEIKGGSAAEVVADPVIAPTVGYVQAGTQVTITCATEGASIYYTIDDTNPTTASTRYNGAFEITSSCTVKAIAVKTDCQDSKVVSAEYTLFELVQGESNSTFDFTTIGNAAEIIDNKDVVAENGNAASNKNGLEGISFVNGPMTLSFAKADGAIPRWWKNTDGTTELRAYNKNVITIKANQNGYKLVKVMFSGDNVNKTVVAAPGTYSNGVWEAPQEAAQEANGNDIVTLLTLTPGATLNVDKIQVIYAEDPNATMSAIDNIVVDGDENAPVEYFNIQGVRVNGEQLAPGLYIMRQGSKTSKIIVK